jgi:hypothetical protein
MNFLRSSPFIFLSPASLLQDFIYHLIMFNSATLAEAVAPVMRGVTT